MFFSFWNSSTFVCHFLNLITRSTQFQCKNFEYFCHTSECFRRKQVKLIQTIHIGYDVRHIKFHINFMYEQQSCIHTIWNMFEFVFIWRRRIHFLSLPRKCNWQYVFRHIPIGRTFSNMCLSWQMLIPCTRCANSKNTDLVLPNGHRLSECFFNFKCIFTEIITQFTNSVAPVWNCVIKTSLIGFLIGQPNKNKQMLPISAQASSLSVLWQSRKFELIKSTSIEKALNM